jgi:hypothetical protein
MVGPQPPPSIRLVAVEAFGNGKALFPTGFVIPKAFGTPNMPDFDCKICLTTRKNDNSPRSKPSTATSLFIQQATTLKITNTAQPITK